MLTAAGAVALILCALLVSHHREGRPATERPASERHAAGTATRRAPSRARTWHDIALTLPVSWGMLEQGDEHASWGTPDRSHTVTVASTAASAAPLSAVVHDIASDASDTLPGARLDGAPRDLALQRAPRGDSAVLLPMVVASGGRQLHVVQVWRRDSRSGQDLVATWSSTDGDWPVDPAREVPDSVVR